MPPPLVRVVVVNYNGGSLTERCLQSILASDWPSERLELVMVDNASCDGLAERLDRQGGEVRVIRSGDNLGFAGGCNLGLEQLGDVDFVALVNNDAVVEPDWLSVLVAAAESDPGIGAASPRIL